MSTEPWVQLAGEAPLVNFETYLGSIGFKFEEPFGDRGAVYVSERGQHVLLPTTREIPDYSMRVTTLIEQLSRFLEVEREKLAKMISGIGFDALKIKTGIGASSFSVDLDEAIDTLHNGYSLVDYSAVQATSKNPVAYIHGRRSNRVRKYLDSVRMGQTEPGSFVLTLLLPTTASSELVVEDGSAISLGERVSETLVSGLNYSHQILREGSEPSARITANFAAALAEIVKVSPQVEIGVERRSKNIFDPLAFSRNDEDQLRFIADRLAPNVETRHRSITGTVVNLTESRAQKQGYFIVEVKIGDELKNVKVPFGHSVRKVVIEAFDRKADVSIQLRGDLVRSASGRYSVKNPVDFEIIERGSLLRLR